ncbi:MAG TPA: hypothetical protein DCX07_06345 [Phycisphaerales bacterium]|nr:hypothetical protein [Phycisphaerales bacterium]
MARVGKLERIAAEAGISPNTVLRVLRGQNKEVWPSAVRRAAEIRKIAMKFGYLPNASARSMRRGSFNCVALLLSTDRGRSYLPDELFNGIHDALNERAIRLVVSKLGDEQLTSIQVMPAILREWSCDGLLINYTDRVPTQMIRLIEKYQIPSIWVNRKLESDCICYDDFGGSAAATQHLLKLGHRKIAYLDFVAKAQWDVAHYSRTDRYEGYAHAMRQAGLTPTPRERFAGVESEDRLNTTTALLKQNDRPTAILSYDAGTRVLLAAAMAGLEVPRDLSLLSFSLQHDGAADRRGEMFIGLSIGAMGLPAEKAGHRAVQMLLRKVAAPEKDFPACVLPLEFHAGDTCGPAATEESLR